MPNVDTLFKRRSVVIERLLPFGFVKSKGKYVYSADLLNGQLKMSVTIGAGGEPVAEVVDALSKDVYALHLVSGATGAFVGQVRQEHDRVLTAIAEACFERDVFKSESAREVIHYVREMYHDELEFLWARFPDNAIFRRKDNAKWYSALLTVPRQKLGQPSKELVEIIDLRVEPEILVQLVDGKRYFPGYHMNKKHWLTICLDGTVGVKEIRRRIDTSYALAVK